MDAKVLDELERLHREATPGPWRVYPKGSCVPWYDVCDRIVSDSPSGRAAHEGKSDADAALIAATRNALPALLTAAREGMAERAALDAIGAHLIAVGYRYDAEGAGPFPPHDGEMAGIVGTALAELADLRTLRSRVAQEVAEWERHLRRAEAKGASPRVQERLRRRVRRLRELLGGGAS